MPGSVRQSTLITLMKKHGTLTVERKLTDWREQIAV
jgi:hypothetical protein